MAIKTFIKTIQDWMPPVHKEGHIFIVIFAAITIVFFQIWEPLGYFGIVATIWCAAFFRDPQRFTPQGDNLIVSPADGIVSKIETAKFPQELGLDADEEVTRVTIFLNIFNVHINRFPIAGSVEAVNYHPGKFLSANLDKASDENERNSIVINTKHKNKTIVCVQIAGLIARRIVCFVKDGEKLEGGDRYGLIRFGSRVDIYLPKGVQPMVLEGQTTIGAETIIADIDVISDEETNNELDTDLIEDAKKEELAEDAVSSEISQETAQDSDIEESDIDEEESDIDEEESDEDLEDKNLEDAEDNSEDLDLIEEESEKDSIKSKDDENK